MLEWKFAMTYRDPENGLAYGIILGNGGIVGGLGEDWHRILHVLNIDCHRRCSCPGVDGQIPSQHFEVVHPCRLIV